MGGLAAIRAWTVLPLADETAAFAAVGAGAGGLAVGGASCLGTTLGFGHRNFLSHEAING